ncbi:MAG: hypothetical protein ACE5IR_05780 [bacterium]
MKKFFEIQLLLLGVGFLISIAGPADAQIKAAQASSNLADSTRTQNWGDEAVYEIEHLRLERWILENTERFADPILLREIAKLKKEAENFAKQEDFLLAVTWMETIWDLLEPNEEPTENDNAELDFSGDVISESFTKEPRFTWTREVLTGVDLWRYQFNFSVPETDEVQLSSFNSDGGNPFTGFRFSFDLSDHFRRSIQGYATFKYSRDYFTGELDVRIVNPIDEHSFWQFENRFTGNSFYRDNNLKYYQNQTSFGLNLRRPGRVALDIYDELTIRRYSNEQNIYPNYLNNSLKSNVKLDLSRDSFVSGGYRNVFRTHSTFDINDYLEHRIDFSWFQSLGKEAKFTLDNELRFRDYTNVEIDTFFQDFTENYFRGELRLPFSDKIGADLKGSITKRDNKIFSASSLPDYWLWEVEPEFYVKLGSEWRVGAGLLYRNQTYEKLHARLSTVAPTANVDQAFSIVFEDYYAFGPTLNIELFRMNGMIFSVHESFLFERHPNAADLTANTVSIYQDRNINSILLFFSWNISRSWRLNVLANMDDERSRRDSENDSQNTLVGLEINYIF